MLSKLGRDSPKSTLQGFHKAWVWVDHVCVGKFEVSWTKCLANAHKSTFVHLYIITLFEWYLTWTRITEKSKYKNQSIQPSSITSIFLPLTNALLITTNLLQTFPPFKRQPSRPVGILRFVVGREGWSKPLGTFGTHWGLRWWANVSHVGWSRVNVVCLGWKTSPAKNRNSLFMYIYMMICIYWLCMYIYIWMIIICIYKIK